MDPFIHGLLDKRVFALHNNDKHADAGTTE
jgi:hypothetical protein